ncbi:hypothetical protein [Mycobacteroides chelonae]|uniref:hypothetical protein n=1 Tax=Mycobacteroides chelonae TaxID=1774 RepID=UPI000992753D|nr:hypothetical protein [Mycobacteroides chelonae]
MWGARALDTDAIGDQLLTITEARDRIPEGNLQRTGKHTRAADVRHSHFATAVLTHALIVPDHANIQR